MNGSGVILIFLVLLVHLLAAGEFDNDSAFDEISEEQHRQQKQIYLENSQQWENQRMGKFLLGAPCGRGYARVRNRCRAVMVSERFPTMKR